MKKADRVKCVRCRIPRSRKRMADATYCMDCRSALVVQTKAEKV